MGRVKRHEAGNDRYIKILKKNIPNNYNLKGTKIVLDCANGAGYKAAPKLLKDLGAAIYPAPLAQSKTILVPFSLKFLGKFFFNI